MILFTFKYHEQSVVYYLEVDLLQIGVIAGLIRPTYANFLIPVGQWDILMIVNARPLYGCCASG